MEEDIKEFFDSVKTGVLKQQKNNTIDVLDLWTDTGLGYDVNCLVNELRISDNFLSRFFPELDDFHISEIRNNYTIETTEELVKVLQNSDIVFRRTLFEIYKYFNNHLYKKCICKTTKEEINTLKQYIDTIYYIRESTEAYTKKIDETVSKDSKFKELVAEVITSYKYKEIYGTDELLCGSLDDLLEYFTKK